MKVCVWSAAVPRHRMAALAEKGHLSDQELAMVTAVNFVTAQTVFLDRGMLKGKRSPLFSVAFITEIVDGISLDHSLDVRCAHRVMAVGTFHSALPDWVMGLLIGLRPNSLVAGETEVRFFGFQHIFFGHS